MTISTQIFLSPIIIIITQYIYIAKCKIFYFFKLLKEYTIIVDGQKRDQYIR